LVMNIDELELIRKGTIEAREYQLRIADEVADKNVIVVLPTGLGKTAIAALVLANSLKRNGGKGLFLAPTRILVQQHKDFLSKVMNIPTGSITAVTGEDDIVSRMDAWQGRIICATPQITVQDYKRKLFDPSQFTIAIVDEVHRAIGNHSYVQVLNILSVDSIQKVGLTATLPTDNQKIDEIRTALSADLILYRDYESDDVKSYIQKVEVETRLLDPTPEMNHALTLLKDSLRERLESIAKEGFFTHQSALKMSFKELLMRRDSILSKGSWNAKFAYSISAKLFTMIKYLETQSYASFISYYEKTVSDVKRVSQMIYKDQKISEAANLIRREVGRGREHPKLSELLRVISSLKPGDRALVFVGYRDTVDQIHRLLNDSGYRSWILIGKQGESGQNQQEQVRAVEEFRRGNYQVLIATQIGEEGLDIAECNIVVFYDNVASAVRFVQRRGRTGRKSSGRMIILMVKGTSDEAYYWVVQRRLRAAKKYIQKLNSSKSVTPRGGTLDSYL